jgi:hypothetical protein
MVYGAVGCIRNGPVYNKPQIFALLNVKTFTKSVVAMLILSQWRSESDE